MSKQETLWFWQKSRLTAEWFEVYSFTSKEYPHPCLINRPDKPTNSEPWSSSSVDEQQRLRVFTPKEHVSSAPLMWYLLIREYGNPRKPTQSLVAFADERFEDGTVIEFEKFKTLNYDISERVAAIRWGFGDPHIEQLYVVENYRRRKISIKLINVADIVNIAGNWGGFIYGGDQVTQDGEALSREWAHSSRLRPIEARLPPMD